MNIKYAKTLSTIPCLLLALILTGCGNSPVGRWESTERFIEIKSNGDFSQGFKGGISFPGTWTKSKDKSAEGGAIFVLKYTSDQEEQRFVMDPTDKNQLTSPSGTVYTRKLKDNDS